MKRSLLLALLLLAPTPALAAEDDDHEEAPARKKAPEKAPAEKESDEKHDEKGGGMDRREVLPEESHKEDDRADHTHTELPPDPEKGERMRMEGEHGLGKSLTFGLGGLVATLGGTFFSIPLDAPGGLVAHAAGGAFQAILDVATDTFDWRAGVVAAYPRGFVALGGSVGIRKQLGPWTNPVVYARGGAGAEFLLGAGAQTVYFAPAILGVGEVGVDYRINPRFSVGGALEIALRYGLPLGIGFNVGGFGRASIWF